MYLIKTIKINNNHVDSLLGLTKSGRVHFGVRLRGSSLILEEPKSRK